MAKYKCQKCGIVFESKIAALVCPKCGHPDVVPYNSFPWKKAAISALALLLGGCVALYLLNRHDGIRASLDTSDQDIIRISVDGVEPEQLHQNYKVEVLKGNDAFDEITFDEKNITQSYAKARLDEGVCYKFNLVHKDGSEVPNVKWDDDSEYCHGLNNRAKTCEILSKRYEPKYDCKTGKFTVTIKIQRNGNCVPIYKVGTIEQSDSVFRNLDPGNYQWSVDGESGAPDITLKQPVARQVSKSEAQNVFDEANNPNTNNIASLISKLGSPSVPVSCQGHPEISTLQMALLRARIRRIIVDSVQSDPCDGLKSISIHFE
jgi:hypothetical protein